MTGQSQEIAAVAARIRDTLLSRLDPQLDISDTNLVRQTLAEMFPRVLEEENLVLSRTERATIFDQVMAETLGYGPIQPLLRDNTVTEIMVNGPKAIYVERNGKIERTQLTFENNQHLLRIIQRIIAPLGRRVDESSPMVDARLPDGSRVNATISPVSLVGPVLTIRKFSKIPYTDEDLVRFGTVTPQFNEFARACVKARLNILVSGGTGSGKTTLLNVLSAYLPPDERIITIEDAAELQLKQEHVVTLEARPANIEGKGQISIRDLLVNSLRMRPDRIVIGEVRSGEALDMLQAMNTGHDGSLSTLHANTARDALRRLETMVLMAGMELPLRAIREQIASALDMIVHVGRYRDGSRRVMQVSEVQGMEGEVVVMQDIFRFVQTGMEDERILGSLQPTGIRPKFVEKIEQANIHLPASMFGVTLSPNRR
ncbi:MAG TPA: CpaF family protein [Anaerolineae bacterium]|nr:CpaF family protein [Anaerolineae bacterium]